MKLYGIRTFTYLLITMIWIPAGKLFAGECKGVHGDTLSANAIYMSLMDQMMQEMDKKSTAVSPEADFLSQMIPHHKGAVAMASYEIRHGKDSGMVQLAKSIGAEQSVEIKLMNLWLSSASLPKSGLPPNYRTAMDLAMHVMMDNMMEEEVSNSSDKAFAKIMIPHHQAAIDMAKVILKYSSDQMVTAFAKSLISNEEIEIEQMSIYLK